MRPLPLAVSLLALAVVAVVLWPRSSSAPNDPCGSVAGRPSDVGIAAASRATVCLVNRQRTSRGLPPLQENGLLNTASLEHSQDMVRRGYFEHTSSDGRTVGDRLRSVGYSRGFSASGGENIAFGVGSKSTPQSIVEAWMRSPGHRADILRRSFTDIGIGIALGVPGQTDSGATYTTDFGGVPDPSLPDG